MAVLDIDEAAGDAAAEDLLDGLGHGGGGLAGADDEDAGEGPSVEVSQGAGDGLAGIGGGKGSAENGESVAAEGGFRLHE